MRMMPGKVAIQLDPPDEKIGSIIIPDNARDNCNLGTVYAVSLDEWWVNFTKRSPTVKVGDRVLVGRYTGIDLFYNGLDLKVLQHDDIIAVIPPDQDVAPSAPLTLSVSEDIHATSS